MADIHGLQPSKQAAPLTSVTTGDVSAEISAAHPTQTMSETEDNVFLAAQRGELQIVKEAIESGAVKATDRDAQNVTMLHWAAINAHLGLCRYLLEMGAEVDAPGGDLMATPLQWAARGGHLYVIQLLISHNADPTFTDKQGFNSLHLVTHSSVVMALLYILNQPIAVDSPDEVGHTALMWAAYQGDAVSVEVLLKHGASLTAKDNTGLTPLHWAVVRGNKLCIRHIIEAGADLNARQDEGKTPKELATELKSIGAYKRALEESGLNEDGTRRTKPLSDRNTKIAILAVPAFFFGLIFQTFNILPWYTAIPLAAAEFFGMHHIVTRVLLDRKGYTENLSGSPYFAGIITGSLGWVGYCWATRLVQGTTGYALTQLAFALVYLLCAWNFFRAVTLEAGPCPKPTSDAELKMIVEDLADQGRLNGQTFCITCMARKPLRAKHCRVCNRCTARFDHHCPWVWNCVGVNNHRQFIVFVFSLVTGIILFDYLTISYFYENVGYPSNTPPTDSNPSSDPLPSACIFPDAVCDAANLDGFLFAVSIWVTFQLTWTMVLLFGQLWQVTRQLTTLEMSNLGRYGFMGGRPTITSNLAASGGSTPAADEETAGLIPPNRPPKPSSFLLNLFGFDRWTKGKAGEGLKRSRKATNPFDLGVIGNCKDFWTTGREVGVDYGRVYDVPIEGFKEARRRRLQEEHERDREGGIGSSGSGGGGGRWFGNRGGKGFMGLGILGGAGGSRDGYTPLRNMDDQV